MRIFCGGCVLAWRTHAHNLHYLSFPRWIGYYFFFGYAAFLLFPQLFTHLYKVISYSIRYIYDYVALLEIEANLLYFILFEKRIRFISVMASVKWFFSSLNSFTLFIRNNDRKMTKDCLKCPKDCLSGNMCGYSLSYAQEDTPSLQTNTFLIIFGEFLLIFSFSEFFIFLRRYKSFCASFYFIYFFLYF